MATGKKENYALRVLRLASMDTLNSVVDEVCEKSGQSHLGTLADMAHCLRKFGAGYYDYWIFEFFDLTEKERDTYLTRFRSKKLHNLVNDENLHHIFDNKDEFNTLFADYIGRTFVDVAKQDRKALCDFFDSHEQVFCKMRDLGCGHGAEKLQTKDFKNAEAFCDYVAEKGFATVEEVIVNHPDLAKVYNGAVNTMRMVTLIDDGGTPHLICAVEKFGVNGRIVDNFGVQGPIDLETGVFAFPGHPGDTTDHRLVTHHPNSGVKLQGLVIPFFQDAKEMVLNAAKVVPQMRYIGWDVATTPNGPVIIEGNNYTAHDFVQLPFQTPDHIGLMPEIREYVKGM